MHIVQMKSNNSDNCVCRIISLRILGLESDYLKSRKFGKILIIVVEHEIQFYQLMIVLKISNVLNFFNSYILDKRFEIPLFTLFGNIFMRNQTFI